MPWKVTDVMDERLIYWGVSGRHVVQGTSQLVLTARPSLAICPSARPPPGFVANTYLFRRSPNVSMITSNTS